MSRTQIRRAIPRKTGPLVAIVALLLTVGTALAVHDPTSPMELDGNIVDGAGGGSDWAAIFDSDGDEVAANLPAGTLDTTGVIQDFAPGASGPDPSYHEPSNKDDQAINGAAAGGVWGCVSVPNPTDKTDIVNAYGMAVQGDAETGDGDTADDQLFYFGVERFDNSGDAFIGLWLFQDEVSCNEETGKFEGSKQTGDILVLANFTGGGSNALIQLFRYTAGVGDAPGTFGELASATGKCENTALGDVAGNNLCATINDTNSFVTPWAMEDKTKPGPPSPDPVREVDPDQFVEGGVNLTDVFEEAGLSAPPCFGSFLAETRSSSSIDATLKDYALGNLDFCDANITITPTETNRVGESHTFIVDVDKVLGSGETAATVGDVEYTLTGSNGIEASDIVVDPSSTCINGAGVEDDLDANGQCTIVFSSSQTGVITGHATVDVDVGGTILTRETDGIGDNSGDAVKTYVDATIDITGDGTNRVGASHSFTATVKIDAGDGNGLVAANNVAVTVQKVDASGAVSNPAGNQACTTDSTGVCSVSFSSNSTGTTTGTASATVTVGGISFGITTANDAAVVGNESVVKTWVDASIDITGDDTNRVDDPHTFTVTVLADDGDGTGPQPVSGQVVSVTLTDSSGGTTVVDDDPDTTSTCDDGTNAAGQCVVVFSSATTGVTTGTASATVTVGGISFLISTATDASTAGNEDATKTWVDARISISGDDTNSIEEAHTFTVLVEKDLGDGDGFVPAAGEDVDVTLSNSNGADYDVDTSLTTCDVDDVNTDADTDSDGECVVVFTSNVAGTVNGSASSSLSVGGVSITVSTDDTGSTGDAIKVFLDGSIRWLKHDGDGNLLGGATFNVCRISRLDSATGTYVPEDTDDTTPGDQPFCFAFVDNNAAYDNDPDDGEIEVIDLILGQYTVEETIPPAGYHIQDPPGGGPFSFPDMTIDPLNVDVELSTIFVNIKAFRIIVLSCDDITDELVVSTVTLDGTFGGTHDTIGSVPAALANLGVTEAQMCAIPGATFGDLPDDTYTLSAIVPKAS